MPRRLSLPDLGWSNPERAPVAEHGPLDYRFTARPSWLFGHLVVIALAITMVLLGRWQWHVAHVRHGDVQNYAYAFQWWIFVLFGIGMWARIMHDHAMGKAATAPGDVTSGLVHSEPKPAVAYRRYVMPQTASAATPVGDDVLGDYNAYLAGLNTSENESR